MSKLINTFHVRFDDETKAEIAELKALTADHRYDLERTRAAIELYSRQAERTHPRSITGGLLAAMAGEAANDAPQPELKTLGQWVFEGHDERLVTAFINANGVCRLTNVPIGHLVVDDKHWRMDSDKIKDNPNYFWVDLGGDFDNSDWRVSATRRQPFNDVDYLSTSLDESVPYIDNAVEQNYWLSPSVPKITDADMQLIFIKNLSEVLIQRMHSMDRFSEDDYAVGGNALEAWDILVNLNGDFGIAIGSLVHHESSLLNRVRIARFHKSQCTTFTSKIVCSDWRDEDQNTWHTITEAELPAFRAALEACYA